jgi:hypothetical protein
MLRPLLLLASALAPLARAADVFLLGGQSNMQGSGRVAQWPADLPREIPHTFFWNGEAFEPLVVGTTRSGGRPGEFGPEAGLGLALGRPDRPLHLIKHFASGKPLHAGWNSDRWVGPEPGPGRVTFYPGERPGDPHVGTLYRDMLARYRAGLKHLEKSGGKPAVRALFWMQGEADAKHEISAREYGESLRRLRARLAEDLGLQPPPPLIFGQVLPHEPALPRFTHRAEIRAAMAAADARSGSPQAQPGLRMVSTDGYSLLPDTVHYDSAGQLRLGRAFGAAWLELTRP